MDNMVEDRTTPSTPSCYTSLYNSLFSPLLLFLFYLPFSSSIDHKVASFFLGNRAQFSPSSSVMYIYTYGLIPGQLFFLFAVLLFILSFISKKMLPLRSSALYILLTFCIGSVLISNVLLKQYWSRPRPKQVIIYGGGYPYCSIFKQYTAPADRPLRSMPCGHATMGFCFFTLFFIGRRYRNTTLTTIGLCTGSILGLILSYARLAQGGHFFSDIIVSFLIMWSTAYLLHQGLFRKQDRKKFKPIWIV